MVMAVYSTLKALNIPTTFLKRPQFGTSQMVMSYHFFNEGNLMYGDGKPNRSGGALQVDLFSKKADYSSTVSEVKALLAGAKFRYFDGSDDIEKLSETEQLYHKVLIFNYVESEVLKNGI
ncbi:MAG TPA: hypothetical protein GX707_08365 [Epulopiscium sp.]|nr:hypothetical protein [Candidatus Epulonipiscium sp.]